MIIYYYLSTRRSVILKKGDSMTPREERALIIAALCKLQRKDGAWLVPSQTAAEKKYVVNLEPQTCSYPDDQETGLKYKCP